MSRHVLVIGLGVSGRSSVELLLKQGCRVTAVDQKAESLKGVVPQLIERGMILRSDREALVWDFDQVVLSPGVPQTHPLVLQAREKGTELIGEIELAFRSLPNRCVGVTGTNGKTTTVLLIAHILQTAGRKVRALGNIGTSLSSYALAPDPDEILVVELSSFQLETMESKCLECAAILNVTPDHLDRYASLEDYAMAKCRIEPCLKPGGILYISSQVANDFGHLVMRGEIFDQSMPWDNGAVASISPMRYIQLGVPERQNVQAAFPLCRHFGLSELEFRRGLETFRKPAHRIEYVAEWKGFSFYNDSKATNIDSVLHAMALFEGPIVLLAGGVDKGASYRPWIDAFQGKVKRIVAFGQAAAKMEAELGESFPFERVETMEEAIAFAVKMAEPPMNILLSPGCSSYDQFRNYEHRGNEFKRLVQALM